MEIGNSCGGLCINGCSCGLVANVQEEEEEEVQTSCLLSY